MVSLLSVVCALVVTVLSLCVRSAPTKVRNGVKDGNERGYPPPQGYDDGPQIYRGRFFGKCSDDGIYYRDTRTFVFCSHGNSYIMPCSPGTENGDFTQYTKQVGQYSTAVNFCDVNLVVTGYDDHPAVHFREDAYTQDARSAEPPTYDNSHHSDQQYSDRRHDDGRPSRYGNERVSRHGDDDGRPSRYNNDRVSRHDDDEDGRPSRNDNHQTSRHEDDDDDGRPSGYDSDQSHRRGTAANSRYDVTASDDLDDDTNYNRVQNTVHSYTQPANDQRVQSNVHDTYLESNDFDSRRRNSIGYVFNGHGLIPREENELILNRGRHRYYRRKFFYPQ